MIKIVKYEEVIKVDAEIIEAMKKTLTNKPEEDKKPVWNYLEDCWE